MSPPSQENSTIHNVRLDTHFTITANSTPADPNLSWAAKGLLWYILSRPKDWKVYVWQLREIYQGKKKGNKKDAIQSLLRELREAGYVKYIKYRDSRGKWAHRYDVYPMPIKDFQKIIPERDHPAPDHPAPGNPVILTSTDSPRNDLPNNDIKESNNQNVHNSHSDSIVSTDSIPFHRKDSKQEISLDDPVVLKILEMEVDYDKYFRPDIVARWIKKFGPAKVLETIKYFFKIKTSQKKPIPKPEAWMESAFKKSYAEVDKTCQENKQFAENLKKNYGLSSLKINKRYCQDTKTGKEYYYYLPPGVFRQALQQMCES